MLVSVRGQGFYEVARNNFGEKSDESSAKFQARKWMGRLVRHVLNFIAKPIFFDFSFMCWQSSVPQFRILRVCFVSASSWWVCLLET